MAFDLDSYEPVASRIQRFYNAYPTGAIHCEIVHDDGQRVVVKATVWRDINDSQPSAVDFAEELISDRGVNSTSRVENCATSATGRAISIAAHGLGPSDYTKKPSREEMAKVQRAYTPDIAPFRPTPQGLKAKPQSGMAEANGISVKGNQFGPLPDWLVLEAAQAGVTQVWDNRDKVAGTKRPWFKDVNGDKAFWPPRGTPDPVVATHEDDLSEFLTDEEPF
jgi:hypothetical protein